MTPFDQLLNDLLAYACALTIMLLVLAVVFVVASRFDEPRPAPELMVAPEEAAARAELEAAVGRLA